MIEVASCVGTVKYIRRGISAISYEVALDTNSITSDGETGEFLTTNLGNFRFIKHVGGDSEEQQDICSTYNYLVMFVGSSGNCILMKKPDGSTSYKYSSSRGNSSISDAMAACNVNEGSIRLIKFMWYDKPIKVDGSYDYIDNLCRNLGVPSDDMQLKILASNTLTVVQNGTDGKPGGPGDRGSSGPIWRQHAGFVAATADAPYQYYTGSNDERFIDVVLIDKVWYRCLQTYKSTGTDDVRNTTTSEEFAKYWTSADMAGFTFIATQFLLADNAKINLFGSNEINLYSSDTEGKIFGSFRIPNGNGDDSVYALWLGAETGAAAPFSVTKLGHTKATDVDISGKITAISGAIGNFVIADGSIKFVSSTKTCEICTNYVQYVDVSNSQALFSGFDSGGLKVELSGKDEDNNDMACKMVVAQDEQKRKNIGLVTQMSGFRSKLAPNELYIGDLFKRAIMVNIYRGNSTSLQRYSVPVAGIGCYIDSENSTMKLVLKGIRSGSPTGSVRYAGEIYEENGYLKIYKG